MVEILEAKMSDIDEILKAEHCTVCFNCNVSQLPEYLSCWPCCEIKRQRKLLEIENDKPKRNTGKV